MTRAEAAAVLATRLAVLDRAKGDRLIAPSIAPAALERLFRDEAEALGLAVDALTRVDKLPRCPGCEAPAVPTGDVLTPWGCDACGVEFGTTEGR